MKTRIISGIIYMSLLLGMLFANNKIVDTIIIFAITVLGMYEYNKAFKSAGYNPISWIGYIGCLGIFAIGGVVNNLYNMLIIQIAISLLVILSFIVFILTSKRRNIMDVMITGFSIIFIPFLFSFIKLILCMENGRVLIWYVLAGAFISDIFAFLIGSKFGKHKLCKDISPKKTIEGSIAGIIGVVVSYIILTIVVNQNLGLNINIWIIIVVAIIVAIVGQFGDLAASTIKRFCKIKDFGSIMPGHGGILDRCDSILFVAPVIYIFFKIYMMLM